MFPVNEEENHVRSMNSFGSENFVKSCENENFLYYLIKTSFGTQRVHDYKKVLLNDRKFNILAAK